MLFVAFVLKEASTLPTHPLQLQVKQMSGLFDVQQLVMSHVALLRDAYFWSVYHLHIKLFQKKTISSMIHQKLCMF